MKSQRVRQMMVEIMGGKWVHKKNGSLHFTGYMPF